MCTSKSKMLFLIPIFIVYASPSFSQDSKFDIHKDYIPLFNFHTDYLGLGSFIPESESVVPYWIRMGDLKAPGDCYRFPDGAESALLSNIELGEIKATLKNVISSQLYNSYVLENISGFKYEMRDGEISRREYYIKYALGDTIYVISGLLGEFLSFYRAIPGKEVISIDELKREAAKLSPSIEFRKNQEFVKKLDDRIYFREYLDRENKMRVRNYQVVEYRQESDKNRDNPYGKYYNLIEITKFLDEEAMP